VIRNRQPLIYAPIGSPIDLKIERANEHRERLLDRLDTFRDREPKPYLIREHIEQGNGRAYRVLTAHSPEPPPAEIALDLGDFLHNLRGALDHLVGQMRRYGPTRDSAFPICKGYISSDGFLALSKKKLAGLPSEACKRIEGMQPYRRGRPSLRRLQFEALEPLHGLWNIDKHRAILLTTSLLAPEYVWHNRPAHEPSSIGFRIPKSHKEAEIWLPLDGDQRFEPHFSIEVALAKPRGFAGNWSRWADVDLEGLVDYMYRCVIWSVIPGLSQFVKGSK
jgi:hypothetical protein